MSDHLSDDFKDVFLAGVGAIALSVEKAKELIDVFVKKGELTVAQGKVLNEELKHNIKEKVRESVPVTVIKNDPQASGEYVLKSLEQLSAEDIAAIKKKLAEMESAANDDGDD